MAILHAPTCESPTGVHAGTPGDPKHLRAPSGQPEPSIVPCCDTVRADSKSATRTEPASSNIQK
eukprot:3092246-Alexandrium_andersonii.AAC.1